MAKESEGQNLATMDLTTPKPVVTTIIATPFAEFSARISPDGHWLAYVSNESGGRQVYVQSFPPSGVRVQVSVSGGDAPRWRGDSRELFFVDRDRNILASTFTLRGGEPELSKPSVILENVSADYVVLSDGNTFYASLGRSETPTPIYVVTNWTRDR
jgi:Tol biopolymer transport system component